MSNLTPSDIANAKLKSGFSHVGSANAGQNGHGQKYDLWRGETSPGPNRWRGPARRDPMVAAQDYCDYVNGSPIAAPPTPLKSAGHNGKRQSLPMSEEVAEALGILRDARAARKGKQGYVYLIVEDLPGGALVYGKVGFSTNPPARVAELQTGNPRKLRLHLAKPGTEADEAALHAKYAHKNVLQEWFIITKELLLEWDTEHQIKPAAQSGGQTTKEVTAS
jgi:hypothetical protein